MSTETFVYLDYDQDLIGVFVSDDSTLSPSDMNVVTYNHDTGNTAVEAESLTLADAIATTDITLTVDGVDVDGTIYWLEFTDVTNNPKSGLALFDESGSSPVLIQAASYGANTKITLDSPNPDYDVADTDVEPQGNVASPYTFGFDLSGVSVPCFTRGTLIATPEGDRPVEELQAGDRVLTRDGEAVICWIGASRVSASSLRSREALRPVRIEAGALGGGLPRRALLVSPRHGMFVSDWKAELLFDAPEAIVEAIALVNDRDIRQVLPEDGVEYFQILCDQHELVFAEGAMTETFFLSKDSARELSPAARAEVAELFPQLLDGGLTPHREVAMRVGAEGFAALNAL